MSEVTDWEVVARENIPLLRAGPVSTIRRDEVFAFQEMQAAIARWIGDSASYTETLTNKTMDDYTNNIHADAVHRRVKNASGGSISHGQPLAYVGYNTGENSIEVTLADNATGVSIGLAEDPMVNGEFGMMTVSGIMEDIDTSSYANGQILYVNGAGILTAIEPTSGFSQPIAFVLRAHAENGALQVLAAYPKQSADDVRYTGTLTSTNVAAALNELDADVSAVAGSIITDHTGLTSIGINTHTQIDTHIADSTIHFTEASIVHQNISGAGTNTHAQIDTHIGDSIIHYAQASISITNSQVSDFAAGVSANETSHADVLVDADIGVTVPAFGITYVGIGVTQSGNGTAVLSTNFNTGFNRYYNTDATHPNASWGTVITVKSSATRGYQTFVGHSESNLFAFRNTVGDGNSWQPWRTVISNAGGQTIAGTLTATTFIGALTGTASNANLLDNLNSTDFVRYVAAGTTSNSLGSASWTVGYADANNIDHVWYDDATNTYSFCADTTYKATANAIVKAATFQGALSGNATTATQLATARTIDITGDITATAVAFDGTANIAISASVNDNSHNHSSCTGDFTVGGNIFLDASEGIYFEAMKHAITWNDGTGNFNIRVGHIESGGEKCTEAGYVFHTEYSQTSGVIGINVSSASLAVGAAPAWREQINVGSSTVSMRYQGSTKLATASDGIDVTGYVDASTGVYIGTDNIRLTEYSTGGLRVQSAITTVSEIALYTSDGVRRGAFHANNSNQTGILDKDHQWAIRHTDGGSTEMLSNNILKFTFANTSIATAVDWKATSDRTLKHKFRLIENALDKIDFIEARIYEFKENPGQEEAGIIAQSMQMALPEIVGTREDGMLTMSLSGQIAFLAAALQELKAEVIEIKAAA